MRISTALLGDNPDDESLSLEERRRIHQKVVDDAKGALRRAEQAQRADLTKDAVAAYDAAQARMQQFNEYAQARTAKQIDELYQNRRLQNL